MRIDCRPIPGTEHRYPTAGDYWTDQDGTLQVRVTRLPDWRYEALVAIHELVEAVLCRHRGVQDQDIDSWDIAHPDDEPGDLPEAPYHREHAFASAVESMLANELGVDWKEYERALEAGFATTS